MKKSRYSEEQIIAVLKEHQAFVNWAIEEKGCSQRRACGLIGLDPKTYRYASRRPDDATLRVRLKALASERRRFGYRRLHRSGTRHADRRPRPTPDDRQRQRH
jgi:hypothetical protein